MKNKNNNFINEIKKQNISSCSNSDILRKLELLVQKKLSKSDSIKCAMQKMSKSEKCLEMRHDAIKNGKNIIENWTPPSDEAISKIFSKIKIN